MQSRLVPDRRGRAAVATTRLSSQSRRGLTRSQERRREPFGFWTICQDGRRRSCQHIRPIGASLVRRSPKDNVTICEDRPPRSAKDIQSIGASLLRRWRKDIATICENWPRRSAKDIRSIGADVARQLSKSVEMNRAASPQRSPEATSRLFSNPWRPNTQARPRNVPPKRNDCYTERVQCRICFARVNHNGGAIPSFGHSNCAIRPRPGADMTRDAADGEYGTTSKPEKPWNANLGKNVCVRSQR